MVRSLKYNNLKSTTNSQWRLPLLLLPSSLALHSQVEWTFQRDLLSQTPRTLLSLKAGMLIAIFLTTLHMTAQILPLWTPATSLEISVVCNQVSRLSSPMSCPMSHQWNSRPFPASTPLKSSNQSAVQLRRNISRLFLALSRPESSVSTETSVLPRKSSSPKNLRRESTRPARPNALPSTSSTTTAATPMEQSAQSTSNAPPTPLETSLASTLDHHWTELNTTSLF